MILHRVSLFWSIVEIKFQYQKAIKCEVNSRMQWCSDFQNSINFKFATEIYWICWIKYQTSITEVHLCVCMWMLANYFYSPQTFHHSTERKLIDVVVITSKIAFSLSSTHHSVYIALFDSPCNQKKDVFAEQLCV